MLQTQTSYDGLGRSARAQSLVANNTAQCLAPNNYATVDTQYDALGRAYKKSNPYCTSLNNASINPSGNWTTTGFDALSRMLTVTTPDSAVVSTAYSGNTVTVTDQAGNQRKSKTDGLGRLSYVIESPNIVTCQADGSGCETDYTYDTLDDLTQVAQGAQTRTFNYDSLKRLTSATNPESGSINYFYDENGYAGLLTHKSDARGVTTTYTFDNLNRNLVTSYTDGTPAVTRSYDAATNGKGRLSQTQTSDTLNGGVHTGALTQVSNYDALGRTKNLSQQFYTGSAWSAAYSISRSYDLAGHVTGETYPSVHTLSYGFDAAGRTNSFAGNLGDGISRTYDVSITYDEWGHPNQEQFGTQTAVYNKLTYNIRGQLSQVRVGTTGLPDSGYNRGALIFHYSATVWAGSDSINNGNLKKEDIYIPDSDQNLNPTLMTQFYTYDSLNRLMGVSETNNVSAPGDGQNYLYDRWGNRQMNGAWGGAPSPAYIIDPATNRLTTMNGVPRSFDPVGNMTTGDNATTNQFDAENRMTQSFLTGSPSTIYGVYVYDGDGRRVRRMNGTEGEVWQVYGLDGELVAEYAANAAPASPRKEYGYRNGQLLITADTSANINWLVSDHLGTPRMIIDKTGTLANVKRHDYLPFGDELHIGNNGRTSAMGFDVADGIREKFTAKERDTETGLDYSINRYYSPTQGRFTSPDPLHESAEPKRPQTWNRYSYVLNNPLRFVDPDGLRYVQRTLEDGNIHYGWCATDECYDNAIDKNAKGYAGWTPVTFDESKPFEYTTTGIGGNRYDTYRLNPDGTNGYARILDGGSAGTTTDWNAQFIIGGLLKGAIGATEAGIDAAAGAFSRQAATQAATEVEGAATSTASTTFGRSIQSLKESLSSGDGVWSKVAKHTEEATAKAYRGGTSIEEVFVNKQTGEKIVRHTIVRGGQVLHDTFRTYSKVGQ